LSEGGRFYQRSHYFPAQVLIFGLLIYFTAVSTPCTCSKLPVNKDINVNAPVLLTVLPVKHRNDRNISLTTEIYRVNFSLRGDVEVSARAAWYRAAWDAANAVLLRHNASLSHHHGVGLLRSPYMRESLGEALTVLADIKRALDPHGILNPGKLGLSDNLSSHAQANHD